MHHDFLGVVRATIFAGIILLVVGLCMAETQPTEITDNNAAEQARIPLSCLEPEPPTDPSE